MLKSLLIRNYVLIDELDIHFEEGFSVITGETGAGKSIILGALSLVLGERADPKSIRSGKDKCLIEALFDISTWNTEKFFQENDLEYDATSCLFRRELYSTGKSRAFINDSPVPLAVIKELGNMLIDIHSQHQNLLLADTHFQLNAVDLMTHDAKQLAAYRNEYSHYLSTCSTLAEMQNKAASMKQEEEYTRFQYEELKAAKLQPGEQNELEKESDTLSHAEEIKTALYKITELLNGEDRSALSTLREAIAAAEPISAYFPKATEYTARLRAARIDIHDLASETDVLKDDIEFDAEQLTRVNDRINTLYTLQQKHKAASVEELITRRDTFGAQLDAIDTFDEALETLTGQREASRKSLHEQAAVITGLRTAASATIEEQIAHRLMQLGMTNARFQIQFTPKTHPAEDGMDDVTFLFSANRNEPLKTVAQTASGGEISRLMLCLKAMIAGYAALPTLIFDEIDLGISGDIAGKAADIMHDLGRKMQIITITHLPQIAAKGNTQYLVYKEDTPERTCTRIRRLDSDERVDEIARMLSGTRMTQAAVDNAKSLLGL
jgi:DNA repair protein RecN (Recombination protein N)